MIDTLINVQNFQV